MPSTSSGIMVRNSKLKSKASSKLAPDPNQRKLSFYLKKKNADPSVTSESVEKGTIKEVCNIIASPKVNEIPPTPIRRNHEANMTSFLLSKSRLFQNNENSKERVTNYNGKREPEASEANKLKKLKLSRRNYTHVISQNSEENDATKQSCIASNADFLEKNSRMETEPLTVKPNLPKTEDAIMNQNQENISVSESSLIGSPSKSDCSLHSENMHKNKKIQTEISAAKSSPRNCLHTASLNKNYTVLHTPRKKCSDGCNKQADDSDLLEGLEIDSELFLSPVKAVSNLVPKSDSQNHIECAVDLNLNLSCVDKNEKIQPEFSIPKPSSKNCLQIISPEKKYTILRTPSRKSYSDDCNESVDNTDSLEGFDIDSELFSSPVKSLNKLVPKSDTQNYILTTIERRDDGVLLTLQSALDTYTRYCLLQGFWRDTLVKEGDRVAVISDFDETGFTTIDNDKGFFIVNNDILVSSTAITSVMFCSRKAVLAERFRGWDSGNQAMFLGNLIHDLFQRVVQKEPKTVQDLKVEFLNLLGSASYIHQAYGLGLTEGAVESQAQPYFPSIFSWIKQYCSVSPSPLFHEPKDASEEISVQVHTVQDIEDNIWCTKYGIKGKVDLTVGVNIHKRNRRRNTLMPLELKTGKSTFSDEHKGQVILYSLMMADRLQDPCGGLLLYLSEGPMMKFIETNRNKERGLIQLRNELAHYFKHLQQENAKLCILPEPISRKKLCQKCPFLLPCSLLESEFETCKQSRERESLVKETTNHLSPSHRKYFSEWYVKLQQEYQCQHKKQRGTPFWMSDGKTQESKARYISNLKLNCTTVFQVDQRFSHTFTRDETSVQPSETNIIVGDFVVLSSTVQPRICITMGAVTALSTSAVTVVLDKDLSRQVKGAEGELYRLDLNHSMAAFDTSFRNLLKLMDNTSNSEKLRKLIIDQAEPAFKKGLKRELAGKLKPFLKALNVAQQRAVLKLLMAEDYILLQGMPGTGKTASIISLVQVLVAFGFSVLLTSYTHSAVDNILLRLRKCDIQFVRLGQSSRIHTDVKDYSSENLTKGMKSVEELRMFYSSIPVVATTSLGLNHPLFKHRTFDYCIVDEASQILQTACLGPLFHSNVFVLVGDSKQLPPVVNSKEAKENGLGESLFKRLESQGCIFELNIQYRMNSEIMELCNQLTYDGKLVCGSDDVANATLQLKEIPRDSSVECLQKVFSMELKYSVIFLDTDYIDATEVSDSVSVSNPAEVQIVSYLTDKFIKAGVSAQNIGVISFYRKQVELLRHKLSTTDVEVNTVDQYQGRDKILVVISCVRNTQGPAGSEILSDERRLNVAITRAKQKLVIVGSQKTLLNYMPFARLFNCLQSEQVVNLKQLPTSIL